MADTTYSAAPAAGGILRHMLSAIGRGLMAIPEANQRAREVERLQSLSDDELARRGLARQDIVAYVFRDLSYI